ncbi:MAG: hypothetical protein ACT4OF_15855 [Caulobacteraceae bacterium]
MSRRPPPAANASVRPDDPSRRSVLGAAAAPLVPGSALAAYPAAEACDTWLARHAEHERLGRRWQAIESRLFKQHNWAKLTRAQRKRFPEKHEMDDLYDRMDALHAENRELLAVLPTVIATSPAGIMGKLTVAVAEVCPEENEEAHLLIASILRDFRAIAGI